MDRGEKPYSSSGTAGPVIWCKLVIISITRYRDIDRGFIQRKISWRTISCTSRACAAHIPQRLIDVARRAHRPWLPLPHVPCSRPIMQRLGSLGWGLGDGSCTSGGLNYACRKAHCARLYRVVDINTAAPVQCPLTLTPACCCVRMSQCNVTPVWSPSPCSG